MNIDEEKLTELLKKAIDEKFDPLFVDRERHHRDHLLVGDIDSSLIEFMKTFQKLVINARATGVSAIVKIIIPGIFALIIGGIILWFKNPIKNLFH